MDNRERFKAHLKRLNLSISKCARLLVVAEVTVWRYTSGLRSPSRKIVKKMKRKLNFEWRSK